MRADPRSLLTIIKRILPAVVMTLLLMTGCGMYDSPEEKDAKFQTLQHGTAPQVPGKYDGHTAVYRLTVADRAAERVVMLDEVDSAFVVLYEGNAYAAIQMHQQRTPIPPEIRKKVTEQVRAEVAVEDVLVTTNLKFVDLIYAYINDANLGRSDEDMKYQLDKLLRDSFDTSDFSSNQHSRSS